MFKGLTVSFGIHQGTQTTIIIINRLLIAIITVNSSSRRDATTGKVDYYGHEYAVACVLAQIALDFEFLPLSLFSLYFLSIFSLSFSLFLLSFFLYI